MADIADDLAVEVGLGFEDAACNEVSLDLGEPDLDLIKPRGIGRSVMEFDVGMGAQILNGCSFMSRKVVSYDMNVGFGGLSCDHLGEKLHELSAGVAVSCLSQDLAGGRVQGRIERKSAVAKVFESVTLARPGESGKMGSRRSRAWMALFSSTQKTAAWAGGFR